MHLTPAPEARRPPPEPLETDTARAVRVGIGVWAILLVIVVIARGELTEQGRGWWVWTPFAGIVLGGLGLLLVGRSERTRR